MKRVLLLGVVLALLSLPVGAQVRLLIIDETVTVEESLRLEGLARGLRATEMVEARALMEWPTERWTDAPFHFVLYLPTEGPWAWLCAPGPKRLLPEELAGAYTALAEGIAEAFHEQRTLVGMEEDLYAWVLSAYLTHQGYLVEGGR